VDRTPLRYSLSRYLKGLPDLPDRLVMTERMEQMERPQASEHQQPQLDPSVSQRVDPIRLRSLLSQYLPERPDRLETTELMEPMERRLDLELRPQPQGLSVSQQVGRTQPKFSLSRYLKVLLVLLVLLELRLASALPLQQLALLA